MKINFKFVKKNLHGEGIENFFKAKNTELQIIAKF